MEWIDQYGEKLMIAIVVHIGYVLSSVAIASLIALTVGILLSRFPKEAKFVILFIGIFQTVPGIVFMGILMVWFGMKPITVIIALAIYAIFPILKNTYTGLIQVDPCYIEVGKSCGMNQIQILMKIELPLAMNSIVAGIRMATIYTVSWAVLAAMIGQGGLGEFIYIGVETNIKGYIIIGSIPAAIIAITFRYVIDKIHHKLSPRGLGGGEE